MLDPERVSEIAEAIADGASPDWSSAAGDALDANDREMIAKLRAVATIGSLFAHLGTGAAALAETSSVRDSSEPSASDRPVHRARLRTSRLIPGTTWGGLRVVEHVGSGRFGDVYRAWDEALARDVALKLVRHRDDEAMETQVVEEGA